MPFTPYTPAPSPSVESKGAANGIASLDAGAKVPATQLPSYVDDVLEYASTSAFPAEGETGKIYVALDTNKSYRWSGSTYVELSSYAEATQSASGLMSSTDKAKLDGIAAGAQINPGNATQSAAGLMSSADKTKLDGIAAGAQVNPGNATQSAAGLMSSTDKTKLDGIATGANNTTVSNSLSDTSTTNALSAAQGKALNDSFNAFKMTGYSSFGAIPTTFVGFCNVINVSGTDANSPYPSKTLGGWHVIQLSFASGSRLSQLATEFFAGFSGRDELWIREKHDSSWGSWKKLAFYDDAAYAPKVYIKSITKNGGTVTVTLPVTDKAYLVSIGSPNGLSWHALYSAVKGQTYNGIYKIFSTDDKITAEMSSSGAVIIKNNSTNYDVQAIVTIT